MPSVSKKQQKFFGIVRAIQKGEIAPTTPETAKAAEDMKKGDVKKFASTKHKGLPEKKKIEEEKKGDHEPEMIRNQLKTAGRASKRIKKHTRKKDNFKAWVQSKITKASDYLDTAADYLDSKDMKEESNPRIPRKKGQPANSKKHSDLYTDENPKGTIHGLGFKNVDTAKASVSKIRGSSRSHAHKIQAAVAMEQRAREMGKTSEAAVYRKYINSMKKKTKKMNEASNPAQQAAIAIDMKKGDVKKFASTKHKGLPEKKKIEEDRQVKKIIKQLRKSVKAHDKQADTLEKKLKEAKNCGCGQNPCKTFGKEMKEESDPRIPRKEGQPANSKKHSDLYTDENPKGTIHGLGFKNVDTAKASVSKIRGSSRSHAHKIQAAVAMEQRAREMGKSSEAAVYRKYINSMKKKTEKMNEDIQQNRKITFPEMQKRIRDAKERRRDQKKESEKLYIDTKNKGVKFYDKKGSGRLKDGKKIYN